MGRIGAEVGFPELNEVKDLLGLLDQARIQGEAKALGLSDFRCRHGSAHGMGRCRDYWDVPIGTRTNGRPFGRGYRWGSQRLHFVSLGLTVMLRIAGPSKQVGWKAETRIGPCRCIATNWSEPAKRSSADCAKRSTLAKTRRGRLPRHSCQRWGG